MQRIFGSKKPKAPPPTLTETTERINTRGESIDEKIRKLDAEAVKYRDQLKRTRPGPAQEALKSRALRVLRQKKLLESQRDQLYNQAFNMEQVSFAQEGIKDAQATMTAMKGAAKDLKSQMKSFKIEDVDNMQDDMLDYVEYASEIQDALGRSYGVPDDIDEDDLMGELDALEADMGMESESTGMPSYLLPDETEPAEPAELAELHMPAAPADSLPQQQAGTPYPQAQKLPQKV